MLYACELVCDRICKHGYVSKYHDWYTYIIYIMMLLIICKQMLRWKVMTILYLVYYHPLIGFRMNIKYFSMNCWNKYDENMRFLLVINYHKRWPSPKVIIKVTRSMKCLETIKMLKFFHQYGYKKNIFCITEQIMSNLRRKMNCLDISKTKFQANIPFFEIKGYFHVRLPCNKICMCGKCKNKLRNRIITWKL